MLSSAFDGVQRLYISGGFSGIGGVPTANIAAWDGAAWSDMAGGLANPEDPDTYLARTFAVFDDGTGPALYAAGTFGLAGGVAVNSLAKWDGTQWHDVGGGVRFDTPPYLGWVKSLQVWDDGTVPALYVGGWFTRAGDGNLEVSGIARWNGQAWSDVGGGTYGSIATMTVWDDGSGESLYCGGNFKSAGGNPVHRLARWDGAEWHDVGGGVGGPPSDEFVGAIQGWDDGTGPGLYVGGYFVSAGGQAGYNNIAKWDGHTWEDLAEGFPGFSTGSVNVMAVLDDGSGPALHMAGGYGPFYNNEGYGRIYRRENGAWIGLGYGPGGGVLALARYDIGGVPTPTIWAGGYFSEVGGKKKAWGLAYHQGGVPEQPADANRDGVLEVKDYFWFTGHQYDINEDGAIDLFDFLDFVNAYNAGCP